MTSRVWILLSLALALMIPSGAAFAAQPGGGLDDGFCDIDLVFEDLSFELSFVNDLEDIVEFLNYASFRVGDCLEIWITSIFAPEPEFSPLRPPDPPSIDTFDDEPEPTDEVIVGQEEGAALEDIDLPLDAITAEKAIRAAFEGDYETANMYFCEAEQISAEEAEILVEEGVEVVELECEVSGDVMTCGYTLMYSIDGEGDDLEVSDVTSIPIVDGKLCTLEIVE